MVINTELIIIGAGPGGYRAAEHAARHGMKVVIFESCNVGGTCLNEGCIPTKALAHHAELMLAISEADSLGLADLNYRLDFPSVMRRKDEVVNALRSGVGSILSLPGITLVNDKAVFVDDHTVEALGTGERYTAPNIIVATGSVSKTLRLEAFESDAVIDSTQLLTIDHLPSSLCIIGAGVIGMEFASIFSAFGVEVTVVEFLKECLPVLDSDIAKRLRKVLERRGVKFHMQAAVKAVTHEGVVFERKGKRETIQADTVLMAVGRAPRVSPDFERAGFLYDERKGISTDADLRTSVPGIYAIGDVNGRQMLAHAAEMQGIHVVNTILGHSDGINLDIMPAAIFTHPEAACVGLSEDSCREQGIDYVCRKAFYRANGKALAIGEPEGMLKLISRPDGTIIGCHLFGAHAADIAQEASVLMCKGTTVDELADMVHIHPTLNEILFEAAGS